MRRMEAGIRIARHRVPASTEARSPESSSPTTASNQPPATIDPDLYRTVTTIFTGAPSRTRTRQARTSASAKLTTSRLGM